MRKILCVILSLIILASLLIYGNYSVESEKIKIEMSGYNKGTIKIMHLSDLHNDKFLCNLSLLVDKINKTECDYIFITGDIVDSKKYDLVSLEKFLNRLDNKAIKYMSLGNHENAVKDKDELYNLLNQYSINLLNNETKTLKVGTQTINLIGINDPIFFDDYYKENIKFKEKLTTLIKPSEYNILLSHRAEYFDIYEELNINLVFSGHAHGGQVRLFNKGIYSPGQGFCPKYTSGLYEKNLTQMIVSRGLGNSQIPLRLFNRPHMILTELNFS